MKAATFALVISQFFGLTGFGQSSQADLVSYHEGIGANADAMRQFDCIYRVEVQGDIPDVGTASSRTLIRMIADFDRNMFLIVSDAESSLVETGLQSDMKRVDLKGLVANGQAIRWREFPSPAKDSASTVFDVLHHLEFPDLRCIGLGTFPTRFTTRRDEISFEQLKGTTGTGIEATKTEYTSTVAFQEVIPIQGDPAHELVQTRQYDTSSLMPLRFSRGCRTPRGADGISYPIFFEHYEWIEVNDIYVPSMLSRDTPEFYVPPHANRRDQELLARKYEKNVTVTFHWISVNEKIDDKQFSLEMLDDISKMKAITDPHQVGATSLF